MLFRSTAAVAYAQLGGYTPVNLSSSAEGKSLIQVLNDLNRYYLHPVDQDKVLRGAITGALGSLGDEFTYYSEPEDNAIDAANLQGEYLTYRVDFRDVYKEILTSHLGVPGSDLPTIFPESQPNGTITVPGLM